MTLPTLPSEITDAIIDHLQSDTPSLGACSFVCSQWLVRSRYHMFHQVQLWPWRVRRFFELANERLCTFTNHVRRIEMDDWRVREKVWKIGSKAVHSFDGGPKMFDTMELPHPPCFAGIQTIQIRNVDWTTFSIIEQAVVRNNLARFVRLDQLDLQTVVFHDLREVVRIVGALTTLQYLTANISFKKYLEHTISSAKTLRLANSLQGLEIGTEEGIAAILSCITTCDEANKIRVLKLYNIKPGNLSHMKILLKKSGRNLQQLVLDFANEQLPIMNQDEVADTIDLSRLQDLRTIRIAGLTVPQVRQLSILEDGLVCVLQKIDSSFLDIVELSFVLGPESDLRCVDWRRLERVFLTLHFFSMRRVRLFFNIVPGAEQNWVGETVEEMICETMPDLYRRGVLEVYATKQGGNDQTEK